MIRIVLLVEQLFMLWMLWDAIQRRSEYYWYIIILMPFGEWFYFFKVKINDPDMRGFKEALTFTRTKPPTVDQLSYRARETPSLANKLAYAQALHDRGSYGEARDLFKEVLRRDGKQKEAILGIGLCNLHSKDYDESIACFQQLIDLDRASFDYEPWSFMAQAQWDKGQEEDATTTLRRLVEVSPRLQHRIALVSLLTRNGHGDEARRVLEAGLEEHRHAPRFLKRKNRGLARQAKSLLQKMG